MWAHSTFTGICVLNMNVTLIYKKPTRIVLTFQFQYACHGECARFAQTLQHQLECKQLGNISIAWIAVQVENRLDLGQIYRSKTVSRLKWHLQFLLLCMHAKKNKFPSMLLFFLLTPLNQIKPLHENRKLSNEWNIRRMRDGASFFFSSS